MDPTMDPTMDEEKQQAEKVEDVQVVTNPQTGEPMMPATPAEEAAVIRKLDKRILPLVLAIYTFSILDRSNLGNARIAGMEEDLSLSSSQYDWLGTGFYIAYIICQSTALGFKHFKPHKWVFCVTMGWSTISTLQSSVQNYAGLLALRILLGCFEAMFAGVPLYLSFFYPRNKLGLRQAVFLSGSALANAYGGALAYAITGINSPLAPWRCLFLIEGLPTWLVAAAAWCFFPDDIATSKFLTARDKEVAFQYLSRNQTADNQDHFGVRWKEWASAFLDHRSYLPGIMYFSCNVCFSSIPLFVPTIISEMGSFDRQQSNGLSAPPYLLCFILMLSSAFASDYFHIRGVFVGVPALMATIGYALLGATTSVAPRYLGIFFAIQIFISIAILLPWVASTHATESKRAGGWAIFATLGQFGSLVGTNIFPKDQGPYYAKGAWICCGFTALVVIGTALFTLLLRWENKKLDRQFGDSGERTTGFRYVL